MALNQIEKHADEDVGYPLSILAWVLAVTSILIVSARLYVRAIIIRRVNWDDWIMLLALILGVLNTSFVQISIHYGLGRHIDTLDPVRATNAVKWDYLSQPSSILSPTMGRISFALMLMTVIGHERKRRLFLWAIIFVQLVVNVVAIILISVQCSPYQKLWNKDPSLGGSCWTLKIQEYSGYCQGSFNALTDLTLALAPAVVFWRLQMKVSIKISVICLMGLGIFAMVGTIVKTILLKSLGRLDDYTYNTSFFIIWWTVELYLVIIAASIPTLRPLARNAGGGISATRGPRRGSHRLKSLGSRQPQLHNAATHLPNKDFTTVRAHSLDDTSSQDNILRPANAHEQTNIRKTVDVRVDYSLA